VKATTNEGLGPTGRQGGIALPAVALFAATMSQGLVIGLGGRCSWWSAGFWAGLGPSGDCPGQQPCAAGRASEVVEVLAP